MRIQISRAHSPKMFKGTKRQINGGYLLLTFTLLTISAQWSRKWDCHKTASVLFRSASTVGNEMGFTCLKNVSDLFFLIHANESWPQSLNALTEDSLSRNWGFFFMNWVTLEQDPNGTFWHSPLHYLISLLFPACCRWLIHFPFPQDNIFRLDANYFENGRGKSPYDPKMLSSSLLLGESVRSLVVLLLNW